MKPRFIDRSAIKLLRIIRGSFRSATASHPEDRFAFMQHIRTTSPVAEGNHKGRFEGAARL